MNKKLYFIIAVSFGLRVAAAVDACPKFEPRVTGFSIFAGVVMGVGWPVFLPWAAIDHGICPVNKKEQK